MLWDALPFEGQAVHSIWSGHGVMVKTPFKPAVENPLLIIQQGMIGFLPMSLKSPFLSRSDYLKLPVQERFKRTIELSGSEEERAKQLHKKLIAIDLHTHITTHHEESGWEKDRERLKTSGLTCVFEALDHLLNPAEDFQVSLEQIGATRTLIRQTPGFCLALSADDIAKKP